MTTATSAVQLMNENSPLLSTAAYISMPVLTLSTPVPYIEFACALILEIATAAQRVKADKDVFIRLAHDLYSLVVQINAICQHISPEDGILNEGSALSELEKTLTEVRDFTKHRTNRSWKDYFDNKSDRAKIEGFRERVQKVLSDLRTQSDISVRRTTNKIPASIAPVNQKTKNPFTKPDPSPSPSMSFGHLSIHGTVTSNNIQGDSNITIDNIDNSTTNCGNG